MLSDKMKKISMYWKSVRLHECAFPVFDEDLGILVAKVGKEKAIPESPEIAKEFFRIAREGMKRSAFKNRQLQSITHSLPHVVYDDNLRIKGILLLQYSDDSAIYRAFLDGPWYIYPYHFAMDYILLMLEKPEPRVIYYTPGLAVRYLDDKSVIIFSLKDIANITMATKGGDAYEYKGKLYHEILWSLGLNGYPYVLQDEHILYKWNRRTKRWEVISEDINKISDVLRRYELI